MKYSVTSSLLEISKKEVAFLFDSFLLRCLDDGGKICSHAEEDKDFLRGGLVPMVICGTLKAKNSKIMKSLYRNVEKLLKNQSYCWYVARTAFYDITKDMLITDALQFCARLLIDYHGTDECTECINLALKFKLAAYKHSIFFDCEESTEISNTVLEFMPYAMVQKLNQEFFMQWLQIFTKFFPEYFPDVDYRYLILDELFEIAHEIGFNIFGLWSDKWNPLRIQYSQQSILFNLPRYLTQVRYGYEDHLFRKCIQEYRQSAAISDKDNLFYLQNFKLPSHKRAEKYRCLQVVYLYTKSIYGEESSELCEEVLWTLWETIPDPFLSKSRFLSCFELCHNEDEAVVNPRFQTVWEWYVRIVLKDGKTEGSPQSLKHLSRCSVRRQLTECAKLPFGVASLDIPFTLKSYLCLDRN